MKGKKQIHRDVWVGLVLLVFSLIALVLSTQIRGEAKLLPVALSVLMAICALFVMLGGWRKSTQDGEPIHYAMTIKGSKYAFIYMAGIVAYYIGFRVLGYWVATPIFLIVSMKYLKVKSWKLNIIVTVFYIIIAFVMFVIMLKLPIYKIGIFGRFFRVV